MLRCYLIKILGTNFFPIQTPSTEKGQIRSKSLSASASNLFYPANVQLPDSEIGDSNFDCLSLSDSSLEEVEPDKD